MEFHGIEKLQGAENWNIWKFAVRNLLQGTKGAYEVCIGEIKKPISLETDNAELLSAYEAKLKTWDKVDRAASQIIVKTLDAKVMMVGYWLCANAQKICDLSCSFRATN